MSARRRSFAGYSMPKKYLRDAALRRENRDAGRVGELLLLRVPHVAESDGLRERRDRGGVARQEMPASRPALPPVLRHDRALLLGRHLGGLARVEAHGEDLVVGPGLEAQGAHAAHEAVGRHAAEHRAVEVDEGQDDGALPEVLREADALAGLVAEDEVERDRLAELLVEADVLDGRRRQRSVRRRRARSSRGAEAAPRRRSEQREEREASRSLHGAASAAARAAASGAAAAGRALTTISSARSTGTRATAFSRSTQAHVASSASSAARKAARSVDGIRLQVRPGRHARLARLGEGGRRGVLSGERALEEDRDAPHQAHDDERDGHEPADEAENAAEVQLVVDRPAAGRRSAGSCRSAMGVHLERDREVRVVRGKERSRSQLARERREPEAEERDGRREVQPVDAQPAGMKRGRGEPEEVHPAHEEEEPRGPGQLPRCRA